MDEFKIVVIVTILISVAVFGGTMYVLQDAINNAKIPEVTRGLVVSKAPVSDSHPANYTVNLSDNQVLYILNNPSLYERILENQSYVFDCRIDFNNKMTIVDNATLIPAST
jgi:hypothetical protein